MADRLKFAFVRQRKVIEYGTATIDVLDPTDSKEMAQKLQGLQFASFVVSGVEDEEPASYSFQPFMEEGLGG